MKTFAEQVKCELVELARLDVPGAAHALQQWGNDTPEIYNNPEDPMTVREAAELVIEGFGYLELMGDVGTEA